MSLLTPKDFLLLVTEVANEECLFKLVEGLKKEGLDCVLTDHDDVDSLTFLEFGMLLDEKIKEDFPDAVLQEVVWDVFCETKGRATDLYDLLVGNVKIAAFA
jgi:hypothetical protein